MNYVGPISGAALGYIHGNSRGAYLGYKLGQRASRSFPKMAPIDRLIREAERMATPPRTPKKRKMMPKKKSPLFKRKLKNPFIKHNTRNKGFSHPTNSTTASKSIKKNKKVHYKKNKKVKVSRNLRLKVQKVISGRDYPGFYHSIDYNEFNVTAQNAQATFQMSYDNLGEHVFSPNQFLNAASVLWNGKPVPAVPGIADAFNFDPKQTKLYVRKSWVVTQFKNNTQRTIFLKMFNCRPKSDQNVNSALGQWGAALTEMAGSGAGGAYSENPLGVTPQTLHADPRGLKQFDKFFAAEVTKYVLDPGQVVDYVVQGPSNMMLDYSKFYNGGVYFAQQKMSRFQFGVMYLDLCSGTLGGTARFPDAVGAQNPCLCWESNAYYSLDMPEKAGIVGAGVAGVGTQLQERHNAYAIAVSAPAIGGLGARVDEENPALTTAI